MPRDGSAQSVMLATTWTLSRQLYARAALQDERGRMAPQISHQKKMPAKSVFKEDLRLKMDWFLAKSVQQGDINQILEVPNALRALVLHQEAYPVVVVREASTNPVGVALAWYVNRESTQKVETWESAKSVQPVIMAVI